MDPLYNILEGVLSVDDINRDMDKHVEAIAWNKFIATMEITRHNDVSVHKKNYDELVKLALDAASSLRLRATKTWPIKKTWDKTEDCIIIADNVIIVKTSDDMCIQMWKYYDDTKDYEHFAEFISGYNDDDINDKFIKYRNDKAILTYESPRHPRRIVKLGNIRYVFKIPSAPFKSDNLYTVFGIHTLPDAEVREIQRTGIR